MKKILFIILAYIVALSGVMSLSSCKREEGMEPIPNSKNSLVLRLATKEMSPLLAEEGGEDALNENTINRLDIFLFHGNVLKWHIKQADMQITGNSVVVPIPFGKGYLFYNNTNSYDVYVVANSTADFSTITPGGSGNNPTALKNLIIQAAGFKTNGGQSAQPEFVMEALVSKVLNYQDADLGLVKLKRVASKIRIKIASVSVPGYEYIPNTGTVMLKHFVNKSALLEGGAYTPTEFEDTSVCPLVTTGGVTSTVAPFYAYEQDWRNNAGTRAYAELSLPLKKVGTDVVRTYKYILPLAPKNLTGEQEAFNSCFKRNVLYDIGVTVNILGALEEIPIALEGIYTIKDWSTRNVLAEVKASDYLVVSENSVAMPNVTNYVLTFNSSIPNVTLVPGSLKATYTYVPANGSAPITSPVISSQMPSVIVASGVGAGNITITSPIPVNLVPKDIEFKITNGPLTEVVKIKQTPGVYFTNEKSVRSSQFNSYQDMVNAGTDLRNAYTYRVTTSAAGAKYPSSNEELILGFPPVDAQGNTIDNADVARMVSPNFEMASQFGATVPKSYVQAKAHCAQYWEQREDGLRKEGWRLPTEAELKYIEQLQHLPANLQGLLMTGSWYWDSYSANGAYRFTANNAGGSSSSSAHVRCIRDIK